MTELFSRLSKRAPLTVGALVLCAALARPAAATILYDFDFSNLSNGDANFSLEVKAPDYITVTGLAPLPKPLATTLGYDVLNMGTNTYGWFLFSQTDGFITDERASLSLTSFLYGPSNSFTGYITAPGVYVGGVSGNAPSFFAGDATLTVSEVSSAPEPAIWALMLVGFAGLGAAARARRRTLAPAS